MNYRFSILLLPAFLTLASCDSKDGKHAGTKAPVRVETLEIKGSDMANATSYSGVIEESESSNLSFSTAGTIKQFNVNPGDRVAKGQVLGVLDDSSLKNAYDIANATLAQAQDAYNRMKILHDSNSLPEIKWVDVQQKLVQAQSAVEIARNALDDAVLRAPFSGIVSEKYADLGQVTAPGIPVLKLIKIGDVKAVISIPQNAIGAFKEGSKARITFDDLPDAVTEGVLIEKGVAANALSRAYAVKYRVPNNAGKFLPGMICTVTVEGTMQDNVILLPQSAVLLDERNRNFVWLDSAGIARKRIVTVNELSDGGIEIAQGLCDGEKVIVKGQQKVCNGTRVESVNK